MGLKWGCLTDHRNHSSQPSCRLGRETFTIKCPFQNATCLKRTLIIVITKDPRMALASVAFPRFCPSSLYPGVLLPSGV